MSTRAMDVWMQALMAGLHEPTDKHIRVEHGGEVVAESGRAVLVWEPRRVVASYAVPEDDVTAELVAAAPVPDAPDPDEFAVLHPGIPFAVHTAAGQSLSVRTKGGALVDHAAFRPDDPALAGLVILDHFSFDDWYEEDERIVGHPREPFHRVDVRRSSRHVRVELDGTLLAESTRPHLLFEAGLPVRYYLPRDDVRVELEPSATRTECAYKGEASYFSLDVDGRRFEDAVWTYPDPLGDAADVRDLVSFFNERFDIVVDGVHHPRPDTEFNEVGFQDGTAR